MSLIFQANFGNSNVELTRQQADNIVRRSQNRVTSHVPDNYVVISNELFEQVLAIDVEDNALSVRFLASHLLCTLERHIGNGDQVSGNTTQVLYARLGDETSTQNQDLLVTINNTS